LTKKRRKLVVYKKRHRLITTVLRYGGRLTLGGAAVWSGDLSWLVAETDSDEFIN